MKRKRHFIVVSASISPLSDDCMYPEQFAVAVSHDNNFLVDDLLVGQLDGFVSFAARKS